MLCIIPVRGRSSRLPYKLFLPTGIGTRIILQDTIDLTTEIFGHENVVIAYDADCLRLIKPYINNYQRIAFLTKGNNGTERAKHVVKMFADEDIVIWQGDWPKCYFYLYSEIDNTVQTKKDIFTNIFEHLSEDVAGTFCCFNSTKTMNLSKIVLSFGENSLRYKSVVDFTRNNALYKYPFIYRDHVGIYCYKKQTLLKYPEQPTPIELGQNLEQLRWNRKIKWIASHEISGYGIDDVNSYETYVRDLYIKEVAES